MIRAEEEPEVRERWGGRVLKCPLKGRKCGVWNLKFTLYNVVPIVCHRTPKWHIKLRSSTRMTS